MCDEKFPLRERAKRDRALLKSAERDEEVSSAFFASEFAKEESFFVYLSFGSETGTEKIIQGLLARGKKVCVPRVEGKEMSAVPLSDRLVKGKFGIFQPEEGEDTPCAVVLTPLLLADGEGYRLGYGGGYYDRYFVSHPNAARVGLMYAGQAVSSLPRTPRDIPLQAAVTENGVIHFRRKKW